MESINLLYFFHNFYPGQLDNLFQYLGNKQHFYDKFSSSFGNSGTQKLISLFMNLSRDNQLKFVEWVDKNYKFN